MTPPVRDFIHVIDFASEYLSALREQLRQPGMLTANLVTVSGDSILDVGRTFEALRPKVGRPPEPNRMS
ncbi:UDP-glucose 4-epimerase [Bradyrhizobium sp. USDA 4474]